MSVSQASIEVFTRPEYPGRRLGRVQVRDCVREDAVDRTRERAQRTDRGQNQQDQQKGVFCQVLTFFFPPQFFNELLHLAPPKTLLGIAGSRTWPGGKENLC